MANNLFKRRQLTGVAASPLPHMLNGIGINPDVKKPKWTGMGDAVKFLMSTAYHNKDFLYSAGQKMASALLLEPKKDDPDSEPVVIKENFLRTTERTLSALYELC